MPVLVVGADTPLGRSVIAALGTRDGEIRAFVSDPAEAARLKAVQAKVAVGDVSDASHIAAAGLNCFSVVFLTEAAHDDRERSFADSPRAVLEEWREAITGSGATRTIWVETELTRGSGNSARGLTAETAVVMGAGRPVEDVAAEVARLDDAATLA
ncbi:MAG: NAD(P)H-binding protein [Acidimicrobiia bacterium]|nr:NAD(P)H-binding protein [Acidimicrobiia bacterium]